MNKIDSDITKAKTYLQYHPRINFETGIIKLLSYQAL